MREKKEAQVKKKGKLLKIKKKKVKNMIKILKSKIGVKN
jgi:Mn-dependent DtxR family transcriptional regulator